MANRSYLYMSSSADPFAAIIDEQQILVAGRNVIPIFWFSAFAASDIYESICVMEDEETEEDVAVPVPALRTTKDMAIERIAARRDTCFRILPDSLQPIYDQWLALVRGMELPHLHVAAEEIWMMNEPEAYETFLRTSVRAMEEFRREDWDMLLGYVSVECDWSTREVSTRRQLGEGALPYLFRGGYWLRQVPWEES